ncbi:MAG: hypothetical protein WA063_01015 [Minisyncoccia bacterium]
MENQNNRLSINNTPKPPSSKVFWFVFFIAIFIYNIVAIVMSSDEKFGENGFIGMDNGTYSMLFYAFLAVSAVNFVVIFKLKSKTDVKFPVRQASGKEINYSLVKIAFAESMAIFGLMLFLMNGNFSHLMLFTVLAIVGMFLVYPKN